MQAWPYILSMAVGVLIGLIYAVVGVRSPAPPIIALLGLLGILLGENGYGYIRSRLGHTSPTTKTQDQTHVDR